MNPLQKFIAKCEPLHAGEPSEHVMPHYVKPMTHKIKSLDIKPHPKERFDTGCRQWVTAWTCTVLFSDNAATFAAVKELAGRQAALIARRDALQDRLTTSARAVQVTDSGMLRYIQSAPSLYANV